MSRIIIQARLVVPGFHYWLGAPEHLSFLRHTHRHNLHIKVGFRVGGSDRELEFFELQNEIRSALDGLYPHNGFGYDFQGKSCEMIAGELCDQLAAFYVGVFEDNENGAYYYAD